MPNKTILMAVLLLALLPSRSFSLENSTELYKKGSKLAMNGDIDGAIGQFKKVIEVSPYYCLGYYGLGKAYLHRDGMTDEAVKNLKRCVMLDTKFAKGYFYLGMAYFFSRKYQLALHSFKRAYQLDDTMFEALYNLAAVCEITDRSYESVLFYRKYFKEKNKGNQEIVF